MRKIDTLKIKQLIIKYLLLVVGLSVLRVIFQEIVPDFFTKTIIGDGFKQTNDTFFGIYQKNFFNLILGVIMAIDLYKIGRNWIIIPILTIISVTAGLFFFSVLILYNLIKQYGHL
jgi:hypothetical protein